MYAVAVLSCTWADVQTAGNHVSLCTSALGLLAIVPDIFCWGTRCCGCEASRLKLAQLVWEKVPLFALAGVSATVTMAAQRADGNKTLSVGASTGVRARLVRAIYRQRALAGAAGGILSASGICFVVASGCGRVAPRAHNRDGRSVWQRRPYLLVGWFFFLGTLAPMLGWQGVGYQGKQGIADRYAYLPFIGLFIMICWAVAEWADQKHLPAVFCAPSAPSCCCVRCHVLSAARLLAE